MSTPDNTAQSPDSKARKSWFSRLPVVSHLRQSVGLQRGMLITGLILCGIVLICAIFAPLIASTLR